MIQHPLTSCLRTTASRLTLAIVACLLAGDPIAAEEIRLREIWVPEAELLRRAADDPDGIVLELAEYRALVLAALGPGSKPLEVELPPIESVVTSARHEGTLVGNAVTWVSTLEARVLVDGWVRCPLSPLPRGLASVVVDDAPGWLVVEDPQPRRSKSPPPEPFLILRGEGVHTIRIESSSPVSEAELGFTLEESFPRAETAVVELTVPGRVIASAVPDLVESTRAADGESTALRVSLGSTPRLRLGWRAERGTEGSEALFAASHRLTALPRLDAPVFRQSTRVEISQRRTDRIELEEGPGRRIVTLESPVVHSWTRSETGRVTVLLKEPSLGFVDLSIEGLLVGEAANGTLRNGVGIVSVIGAYSETGQIVLAETSPEELEIVALNGVREISPEEMAAAGGVEPLETRLPARAFSFASSAARIDVLTRAVDTSLEVRSAARVRVLEGQVDLNLLWQIEVLTGRLYDFEIALPAPWELRSLTATSADGQPAALRFETNDVAGVRTVTVTLERAVQVDAPLEIRATLEDASWTPGVDWISRDLTLTLPFVRGAARARVDLAVSLANSLHATVPAQAAWTPLAPEALPALGLEDDGIVAALTGTVTGDTAPNPILLTLFHRAVEGEVQSITWILVLEDRLRVRSDLRVAVVDRPIDELGIRLPVPTATAVHVLGDGVKEVVVSAAAANGSLQSVRFAKPWTGARDLRIEYEIAEAALPQLAGTPARARLPWIGIEETAPTPTTRRYHLESFLVFSSQGAVRVDVDPGDELVSVPLEDLPELGEAWSIGRQLFAYRYRSRSGVNLPPNARAAALASRSFAKTDLVDTIVRDISLTTLIGSSGVSRTSVEIRLAYDARRQSLDLALPPDARLVSASVDDAPARNVRRTADGNAWQVPLPARSYASLKLVYERGDRSQGLDAWGRWSEPAPSVVGVPVLTTRWTAYHPDGFRFWLEEGALRSTRPDLETRPRSFLAATVGRLIEGRWPRLAILEPFDARRTLVVPRVLELDAVAQSATPAGALRTVAQSTVRSEDALGTSTLALLPEGRLVETEMVGGDASLSFAYDRASWRRFAVRAVFLVTLLLCGALAVLARRTLFYTLTLRGLLVIAVLADLLSWSLGWVSPYLLTPVCEGLLVSLLIALLAESIQVVLARLRSRSARAATASVLVAALTLAASLVVTAPARGQDAEITARAPGEVLLPYDPKNPGSIDEDGKKVYVPYTVFRALWLAAHPGELPVERKPPQDLVLANAQYSLSVDDRGYRLTGSVALESLVDDWVKIPLPFARSQLARLTLDGKALGVASEGGVPFFAFREKGTHQLELEIVGTVLRDGGTYSIRGTLLGAAATRVEATLAAGARPTPRPTLVSREGDDATLVTLSLGSREPFELSWNFERVEDKRAAQVESVSYNDLTLTLDGYSVRRFERIVASGSAVESLVYRVLGDWRVRSITGAEVADWTQETDDDGARIEVRFARPVRRADLAIDGFAPLVDSAEGEGSQVASLALVAASREESYFGVRHGADRRWHADLLGTERVSREELSRRFSISDEATPDRIYRFYGSGAGAQLGASAVTTTLELNTEAVAVLLRDHAAISVRTRLQVVGPGPLGFTVALPAEWEPRNVRGASVEDWGVRRTADGWELSMTLNQRARNGTEITWAAERRWGTQAIPSPFALPVLRTLASTMPTRSEKVTWTVASSEELDVTEARSTGLSRIALDRAVRWLTLPPRTQYRFALSSAGTTPSYDLAITASQPAGRFTAQAVSIARIAEDFVLVNSRIVTSSRGGAEDRFLFRLPVGAGSATVRTRGERSSTPLTGRELDVTLIAPVVGEHAFDISYRVARASDESPIDLGPIEILAGGSVITDLVYHVAVLETERALVTPDQVARLAPIDPSEMPYLPDGVAIESLGHAYRATTAGWALRFLPEALRAGETAALQVDLAELTTRITSDGTRRTNALYTIRNRDLQFLRIALPTGASLWGVTLSGRPVVVSEAEGALQIPLEYVGAKDLSLEVGVAYEEPRLVLPSWSDSIDLSAPRLSSPSTDGRGEAEIAVLRTLWHVELPDGYSASFVDGNVQEVTSSTRFASKVESILEQVERVRDQFEPSSSGKLTTRQRQRAEANLRQLQQVLSDNVVELEETLEEGQVGGEANRFQEAQLRELRGYSSDLLEKGRSVEDRLQKAIEQSEQDQRSGRTARDQAFEDNRKFRGNNWSFNDLSTESGKAPQQEPVGRQPVGPQGLELDKLLDRHEFRGLKEDARRPDRSIESSAPRAVEGQGLDPLTETTTRAVSPALETPPTGGREVESRTFRREGGGAQLRLRLTANDVSSRLASLLAVVAVGAFIAWRTVRRRRRR